ncbi:fatty acid-binding protein 1, liver [Callorhinchus milii]|uniref:Fatty acid-binding protein 1, liver n=1 Tax=Callorhinchus milii TaxID=7868 RepID=V9LJ13_CALMI|nr:fatty acid-binding protein 1, liver [Callorhinchus milii]|eukprot:gi/632960506/ref/XP_007896233.1/ PREDICTED: fatty acid-binding protein 1, liver-like [Callorhinchus milii]
MDFSGQYELQSQENAVPFMKAMGLSDEMIGKVKDLKSTTKIVQTGQDILVAIHTGSQVLVNEFTLGKEMNMETPTGDTVKAMMKLEGDNKLVVTTAAITSVAELVEDRLINTITFQGIVYKRISKKVIDPVSENGQ